ncbi:SRPBCC family protein [Streptomyces sp. CC208A]|uniref:SRPBCC family protein n=1 Tax=Streptomyces sp. CC208A TaxID=3044573 RepID=UPI0032BF59AF
MSRIEESTGIARSPEDVFSYLMDPGHMPEWQEGAVSARQLDEGPCGSGRGSGYGGGSGSARCR